MNEQVISTSLADLRKLVVDPTVSLPAGAPQLAPDTIRLIRVVLEWGVIAAIGWATHQWFFADSRYLTVWHALGVSIPISVLAVLVRNAMCASAQLHPGEGGLTGLNAMLSILIAFSIVASARILGRDDGPLTWTLLHWIVTWSIASALVGGILRSASARMLIPVMGSQRVLLVGDPDSAAVPTPSGAAAGASPWRVVQAIDDRRPNALDQIVGLVNARQVDVVAFSIAGPDAGARITAICNRLSDRPVRLALAINVAALTGGLRRAGCIGQIALVDLWAAPYAGWQGIAKRALDILLSLVALIVFAPVMVVAVLAIFLETGGPVLFRQMRFGIGSRPIRVIKFRTMFTARCDETGSRATIACDPRVSRVGRILRRSSIDELPQLFNVLRGDMSLVGPRAHPIHMQVGDRYYFEVVSHYRARHVVRPGMTGWAQVNGSRGVVDTLAKAQRRLELDLWYLEHWSLMLDLQVIWKTMYGAFISLRAD